MKIVHKVPNKTHTTKKPIKHLKPLKFHDVIK